MMAMAQADQVIATVEEDEEFGPMMLNKLEVCNSKMPLLVKPGFWLLWCGWYLGFVIHRA